MSALRCDYGEFDWYCQRELGHDGHHCWGACPFHGPEAADIARGGS